MRFYGKREQHEECKAAQIAPESHAATKSLCIGVVNLLQQQVAAMLTFAPLCSLMLSPTCWRRKKDTGKKGGGKQGDGENHQTVFHGS